MAGKSRLFAPLRRRLGHVAQAALAYGTWAVIGLLPLDWASALGGAIARTIGPHLRHSERARRNLRAAFPDKDAAEIERIVRGVWDNLGRTAFEFPLLARRLFAGDGGRVEIVGAEHIRAILEQGRPAILFSAHLANWEVPAFTGKHLGLTVNLIYRAPNNPLMERLFSRRRPGYAELIPKGPRGAGRAIALLNAGGHLGMVVDQKMNDGIAVPFFGRPAMTAPALARLALKYRCPVVAARTERLKGARFRVTIEPFDVAEGGDHHADIATVMGRVNALLESWVRARPEQWLWLHNRWPD